MLNDVERHIIGKKKKKKVIMDKYGGGDLIILMTSWEINVDLPTSFASCLYMETYD